MRQGATPTRYTAVITSRAVRTLYNAGSGVSTEQQQQQHIIAAGFFYSVKPGPRDRKHKAGILDRLRVAWSCSSTRIRSLVILRPMSYSWLLALRTSDTAHDPMMLRSSFFGRDCLFPLSDLPTAALCTRTYRHSSTRYCCSTYQVLL